MVRITPRLNALSPLAEMLDRVECFPPYAAKLSRASQPFPRSASPAPRPRSHARRAARSIHAWATPRAGFSVGIISRERSANADGVQGFSDILCLRTPCGGMVLQRRTIPRKRGEEFSQRSLVGHQATSGPPGAKLDHLPVRRLQAMLGPAPPRTRAHWTNQAFERFREWNLIASERIDITATHRNFPLTNVRFNDLAIMIEQLGMRSKSFAKNFGSSAESVGCWNV